VGRVEDLDAFLKKRGLGPDALNVNLAQFQELFAKHRGNVKAALLNQQLLAGIGNIYADEILFRARIHPATNIVDLNDKTRAALFRATHYILEKAIAVNAEADRLPKSWLLFRRHEGGKCPRCGRKLNTAKIGGRTTWFCAHCQKRPS
jgi:formamidopyrimidine-DNA glycosylase